MPKSLIKLCQTKFISRIPLVPFSSIPWMADNATTLLHYAPFRRFNALPVQCIAQNRINC